MVRLCGEIVCVWGDRMWEANWFISQATDENYFLALPRSWRPQGIRTPVTAVKGLDYEFGKGGCGSPQPNRHTPLATRMIARHTSRAIILTCPHPVSQKRSVRGASQVDTKRALGSGSLKQRQWPEALKRQIVAQTLELGSSCRSFCLAIT